MEVFAELGVEVGGDEGSLLLEAGTARGEAEVDLGNDGDIGKAGGVEGGDGVGEVFEGGSGRAGDGGGSGRGVGLEEREEIVSTSPEEGAVTGIGEVIGGGGQEESLNLLVEDGAGSCSSG